MSIENRPTSDADILSQIRQLAAGISDERTRKITQDTTAEAVLLAPLAVLVYRCSAGLANVSGDLVGYLAVMCNSSGCLPALPQPSRDKLDRGMCG
jgi:hypothetical protein